MSITFNDRCCTTKISFIIIIIFITFDTNIYFLPIDFQNRSPLLINNIFYTKKIVLQSFQTNNQIRFKTNIILSTSFFKTDVLLVLLTLWQNVILPLPSYLSPDIIHGVLIQRIDSNKFGFHDTSKVNRSTQRRYLKNKSKKRGRKADRYQVTNTTLKL